MKRIVLLSDRGVYLFIYIFFFGFLREMSSADLIVG